MASSQTGADDFYQVLGVGRTASDDEIKRSYKKLAMRYHPDKNADLDKQAAAEQFRRVSEAYQTLSDPQKRSLYDRFGSGTAAAHDLFGSVFQPDVVQARRTPDMEMPLKLSLRDFYQGCTRILRISRKVVCVHCKGQGTKPSAPEASVCPQCRGQGQETVAKPLAPGLLQQILITCRHCHGSGRYVPARDRCPHCANGSGIRREQVKAEVRVEPGMPVGERIVLYGCADESPGMEPGNVLVVLQAAALDRPRQEAPSSSSAGEGASEADGIETQTVFSRVSRPDRQPSADLAVRHKLSLAEALLGYRFELQHLDGRVLTIESPPAPHVTQWGEVVLVQGEGMPIYRYPHLRGNLIVHLDIVLPAPRDVAAPDVRRQLALLLPGPAGDDKKREPSQDPATSCVAVLLDPAQYVPTLVPSRANEEETDRGGQAQCVQQ